MMKKESTLLFFVQRIAICFFLSISVFVQSQTQQSGLSADRLRVWKDMIYDNNIYVSAYFGHGSYSMNGMRRLSKDIVRLSGLNATVNSDFPPFWLYGVSVSQTYDDHQFGFNLESMSTGSRSSISDYSGLYVSDFICSGYKLGVFIEKDLSYKINTIKELSFGYRLEAGSLASKILYKSQVTVYNMDQGTLTDEFGFISATTYIEPAVFANWKLDKKTFIQFSTGFMLDLPSVLYIGTQSEYQIGWAGYRFRLGLLRQM